MLKSKKLILNIILAFITALCLVIGVVGLTALPTAFALNETHNHAGYINWGDETIEETSLPTEAGSYVLTNDITLTEPWNVPHGEEETVITNLCLNGHVIKMVGETTVISISQYTELNIYDCGSEKYYFNKDSATGLWTLAENQNTPTDYFVTGGVITGGKNSGVSIASGGVFNMFGGNIVGNTGTSGGGISSSGTFNFYGGNVVGNVATENGGGVNNSTGTFTMTGGIVTENTAINGGGLYSALDIAINILTGGIITENTATSGGGVYYKAEECFAAGTLITMEDGTQKPIETLSKGESVRVFDHENGTVSSSKLFDVWKYPEKHSGVVELLFSHNVKVTVVYGHSFFEKEQNKYVSVTKDNVSSFIGHKFYNVDNARWETLEGYNFIDGEVDTYVITTEYQLNCVANGMLSNEDGFYTLLTNIFEYGDNLKIDQVKKAQDIADFGLYDYEDSKLISKYVYDVLNVKYINVAIGKGMITESELNHLVAYYAEVDPELYCSNEKEEVEESKKPLMMAPLMSPLTSTPVSAPTTSGIYLGGSIKITNNISGNLYLCRGKAVNVGTGTEDGGNGVELPTSDMEIGITLEDGYGSFALNVTAEDAKYFFPDSDKYVICFNAGKEEENDEYLELKKGVAFDEEYSWNNGTAITYGDDYTEIAPKVYHNEAEVTGLTFTYTYYQTSDGTTWTKLEEKPENAGNYKVEIAVDGSDIYTGAKEYSFAINKVEQVIEITDPSKVYDRNPVYVYYTNLGDVSYNGRKVEFKLATESDDKYTENNPKYGGTYIVRITLPECTNYFAGSATKEFTISKATIGTVGFADVTAPVQGETAETIVSGLAMDAKYTGTITWSPNLLEGKFNYDTEYTAKITFTITGDNNVRCYKFAESATFRLKGKAPGVTEGWVKSNDSTEDALIFTKTFTVTEHSLSEVPSKEPTYTESGYKLAYYCPECRRYFEDSLGEIEIGYEEEYNAWKLNDGYLPKLIDKGKIITICIVLLLILLIIVYLLGYFLLYRKGKLDDENIKVIYKFLPRGDKNKQE